MSIAEPDIVKFQKGVGKSLKKVRLSKNLSQLDLAVLCDMEKTSISRIENGRTNITLRTIYKLSYTLNIKYSELFGF